jgi:hypothetical protein
MNSFYLLNSQQYTIFSVNKSFFCLLLFLLSKYSYKSWNLKNYFTLNTFKLLKDRKISSVQLNRNTLNRVKGEINYLKLRQSKDKLLLNFQILSNNSQIQDYKIFGSCVIALCTRSFNLSKYLTEKKYVLNIFIIELLGLHF